MTGDLAIRGLGAVGAFGCGAEDLAVAMAAGTAPLGAGACTPDGGELPVFRADPAPLARFVERKALRRLDRFSQLAVLAAHEALADAGCRDADLTDVGLVVATGYGPATTTTRFLDTVFDDGDACASPTRFTHTVHNAATAALSMRLGIRGPCATVSQFELSFGGALLTARQILREDRAPLVLCGAVDAYCPLVGHCYRRYFGETGAGPPRPWDLAEQSAVPGEGAAFLVLGRSATDGRVRARIDDVRLGTGAAEAVAATPAPGRWFLGADGHRACCRRYGELLPAEAPRAACAPLYGSFPSAPALDLAAAVLHLEGRDLAPALVAGGNALASRATCLKLKDADDHALIGLRSAGGGDA